MNDLQGFLQMIEVGLFTGLVKPGDVNEAALDEWSYEITSELVNPRSGQVGYNLNLHSLLVGDFTSQTTMNLVMEDDGWKVQWDDALIMKELAGGNNLRMDYRIPARANIYDSQGNALVAQTDAMAIGLDTGKVNAETQGALLSRLAACGIATGGLEDQIDAYRRYGYYLPIADMSIETFNKCGGSWSGFDGVILSPLDALRKTRDDIKGLINIKPFDIIKKLSERYPNQYALKFASGGLVPGHGNRDSVKAVLTAGEFVIRKNAVKKSAQIIYSK